MGMFDFNQRAWPEPSASLLHGALSPYVGKGLAAESTAGRNGGIGEALGGAMNLSQNLSREATSPGEGPISSDLLSSMLTGALAGAYVGYRSDGYGAIPGAIAGAFVGAAKYETMHLLHLGNGGSTAAKVLPPLTIDGMGQ